MNREHFRRIAALLLIGAATIPNVVRAQSEASSTATLGVVSKLFENFTDVSVFGSLARFTRPGQVKAQRSTTGLMPFAQFGLEFSWSLGSQELPICALKDSVSTVASPTGCFHLKRKNKDGTDSDRDSLVVRHCDAVPDKPTEIRYDSTFNSTGIVHKTSIYTAKTECHPEEKHVVSDWSMGLAYVQSAPFTGADTNNLTGTFREFPRVSIYGTRHDALRWRGIRWLNLQPYWGGSIGLTTLDNMRITGTNPMYRADTLSPFMPRDTVLTAPSEDYVEAGTSLGVTTSEVLGHKLFADFFVEAAYTNTPFPSIKWSNESFLRPGSPRHLDLSTFSIAIGFQVGANKKK